MTTTTTEEQSTQEPTQEEREAEAGFAAGYAGDDAPKESGQPDAAAVDAEAKAKADAEAKAKADADAKAAADAAEKAAYEALPKSVRDELAQVRVLKGAVDKLAGHIGGLSNGMQRIEGALKSAKSTTEKAGGAAPTDSQIREAASDPEALKRLVEEYPDLIGPVVSELSALRTEIGKTKAPPTVDLEAVRRQAVDEAEERAFIRFKHPDWKDTVKTPEFKAWTLEGGPSAEVYAQMKAQQQANPAKRDEIEGAFAAQWAREHPQWWADRGAAMFGSTANDAIKLLDGFSEARKKAQEAAGVQHRKQKRLEQAVTPQGLSTPPGPATVSEQEAFERGYASA